MINKQGYGLKAGCIAFQCRF